MSCIVCRITGFCSICIASCGLKPPMPMPPMPPKAPAPNGEATPPGAAAWPAPCVGLGAIGDESALPVRSMLTGDERNGQLAAQAAHLGVAVLRAQGFGRGAALGSPEAGTGAEGVSMEGGRAGCTEFIAASIIGSCTVWYILPSGVSMSGGDIRLPPQCVEASRV
jgi:hypothetical protein